MARNGRRVARTVRSAIFMRHSASTIIDSFIALLSFTTVPLINLIMSGVIWKRNPFDLVTVIVVTGYFHGSHSTRVHSVSTRPLPRPPARPPAGPPTSWKRRRKINTGRLAVRLVRQMMSPPPPPQPLNHMSLCNDESSPAVRIPDAQLI